MRKPLVVFIGAAILFMVSAPLWGQTGCDDSPEDPTVMLALVGGAGALVSMAWTRAKARRKS
jgi:XrtJ-associated TM-motif-TM protein